MARQTSQKTVVSRLFANSIRPIYLLDASRRIAYANQALADWVRVDLNVLVGKRCTYTATREGEASDIFNQLCPPPQAWRESAYHFHLAMDVDGRPCSRRASCFHLSGDPDNSGVLVVLSERNSTPRHEDNDQLDSDALHRQLVELRQTTRSRYSLDRLVGKSPAMRRVRNQIGMAIASDASRTLIVGNDGTGRETIARTIHTHHSNAAKSALVPLSCEILDADLLQTTLDALAGQSAEPGGFAPAILLLNVDQLNQDSQAALARHLTQKCPELRTLSTSRTRLTDLVALAGFREDLSIELVSLEIALPRLIDRIEDVPLIAQWFVEEMNAAGKKQLGGFTVDAMEALLGYEWPGDDQECIEFVQAAYKQATGPLIGIDDLPRKISLAADAASVLPAREENIDLDEFLANIETEAIQRALKQAKGNKAQAARSLSVSRAKLLRRIEQLGIE